MIYFDNNATTALRPEVQKAVTDAQIRLWGNPSSKHALGVAARNAVDQARQQLADALKVSPAQVIFTGSATEACQLAIHSAVHDRGSRRKVVVAATEHAAIREWALRMVDQNEIATVPVRPAGVVDHTEFVRTLGPDTFLACAMWANNETGVINPVEKIAESCAERAVPFLCDAVQAFTKLPINLQETPATYAVVSAHKIGGPKGIGALVTAPNAPFSPQILGGYQEDGRRAGTENVPAIVGFGLAAQLATERMAENNALCARLRADFESGALQLGAEIHGKDAPRIANTSNLRFPGIDGETLVELLDLEGICISTGSACHAGAPEPSHVIRAMSGSYQSAKEAVRFSFGPQNSPAEISRALAILGEVLTRLR